MAGKAGKSGRKLKEAPPNAAAIIEDMAANGYKVIGIAKRLNTSVRALQRWISENPDLQDAMDNGREVERWKLHNMLYLKAMNGDTTAAIFLLKARHGYRDQGAEPNEGNKVQINFQLPGAMSMNDFQKPVVIEHGNSNNRNEPVSKPNLTRT